MKYLLFTLFLTGCFPDRDTSSLKKDPHWKYNETVFYEVPEFYQLVCSGKGTVEDKRLEYDNVVYVIRPDTSQNEYDCFNAQNSFTLKFQRD